MKRVFIKRVMPLIMILVVVSMAMGCIVSPSPTPTPTPTATTTPTPTPTPTPPPNPAIAITSNPPKGSTGLLIGNVSNVNPADYKVAVYIFVSGWWNKPYWDQMLTSIDSNRTWQCDIVTDPGDVQATKIAAFLVPNGYTPPKMEGQPDFPAALYSNATANVTITR